ncbi:hypothetical protein B0H14DRAFT_2719853, partial [Mycena olivaceomarginata]
MATNPRSDQKSRTRTAQSYGVGLSAIGVGLSPMGIGLAAVVDRVDEHRFLHWNGPSEREHLSDQRAGWSTHQREERKDDLATYDALAKDREEGQEEWRFSLMCGHALQEQIQLGQAELKLDKRWTDLREELKTFRAALEFEKQARRDWVTQRGKINTQMKV